MARAAMDYRPRSHSRYRTTATPVAGRVFLASLVLATGLAGWTANPLVTAAAFGAGWLPSAPALPAAGILTGFTVAIDPGHGGYDDGVLLHEDKPDEVREADINLAVCLKLREILERAGATVVLTRDEDEDLIRPGDVELYGSDARADLSRRAEVAMAASPDLFLSIHCNAFPSSEWRGSQVFYLTSGGPGCRRLADIIQGELARVTGETDRMANCRAEIYLLKKVSVPAATVELGFLSNPRDLQLLTNRDYQHLCAMAIFFGICRFVRLAPVSLPDAALQRH